MKYISLNDGIAMMTRISTGTTVHRISITVLCEVRVGTGLRLARNRTIT